MNNHVNRFRQNAREAQRTMVSYWLNSANWKGSYFSAPKPSGETGRIVSDNSGGNPQCVVQGGKQPSQCEEKVFGCFGTLTLGGPSRLGCPRLALHEGVTQPGSSPKECGGVCPNQPHAGVGPGWSRRDRGPTLEVSQPDTIRHGRYPQAVVSRAWKRALVTVMNSASW